MKIELYHDILARKVFEMASPQERSRLQAEHFIRERYNYFLKSGVLLGKKDLEFLEPHLSEILMNGPEAAFINKSQLEEGRLKRIKRNSTIAVIGFLAVSLFFALWQLYRAKAAINDQKNLNLALQASAALNSGDPSLAFRLLQLSGNTKKNKIEAALRGKVWREILDSGLQRDLVHTDSVTAFDVSDTLLATGTLGGGVFIWDFQGNLIRQFHHQGRVNALKFSTNYPFLLSGADDGKVLLCHLETSAVDTIKLEAAVKMVDFSAQHPFFLIGSADGQVRIFELGGGELPQLAIRLNGPILYAGIAPRGDYFLAADPGYMAVGLLSSQLIPFRVERTFSSPLRMACFVQSDFFSSHPPVFIERDTVAEVLDPGTNLAASNDRFYKELIRHIGKNKGTSQIYFGQNPRNYPQIAWVAPDSTVNKWTYGQAYTGGGIFPYLDFILTSKVSPVFASFSPDDRHMIISYNNGSMDFRETEKGRLVRELKAMVTSAKFSKSGRFLVTSDRSQIIHIWQLDFENPADQATEVSLDKNLRNLTYEEKRIYWGN